MMMHGMPHPHYYRGGGDMYHHHHHQPPPRQETRAVVGSALDDTHKNPNKVFVGGLKPTTTNDMLKQHMQRFGRVVDAAIVTDKVTGASRGFGFCSFANEECVKACMDFPHVVSGSKVDVRRAVPSSEISSKRDSKPVEDNKVFVGGIPPSLTEEKLSEFCESFGRVKEVSLRYDINNRSRGFGFVTFEDAESASRALGQHDVSNHKIEIKKATPQGSNFRGGAGGKYGRPNDLRPQPGYGLPVRLDPYGYCPPPHIVPTDYGFPHPSYPHPGPVAPYDTRYVAPPYYGGGFDSLFAECPRMPNGRMNGGYDMPSRNPRYPPPMRNHPC